MIRPVYAVRAALWQMPREATPEQIRAAVERVLGGETINQEGPTMSSIRADDMAKGVHIVEGQLPADFEPPIASLGPVAVEHDGDALHATDPMFLAMLEALDKIPTPQLMLMGKVATATAEIARAAVDAARADGEHATTTRIVAALRAEADRLKTAGSKSSWTRVAWCADLIERGEFDGLAASDD